jgi:hypothetical protein
VDEIGYDAMGVEGSCYEHAITNLYFAYVKMNSISEVPKYTIENLVWQLVLITFLRAKHY